MRVYVESILPCSAELAWEEVRTSRLLLEVVRPLVVLRPLRGEQFSEHWTSGQTMLCRTFLFGLIPLGVRTVHFTQVDSAAREIHTREFDRLIHRWDHVIRVRPIDGEHCRYSDEIEVEAGRLTRLAAWFVGVFYRHRQRRWQRVARRIAMQI